MSDVNECPVIGDTHIRSVQGIAEHLGNPHLVAIALQNAHWQTGQIVDAIARAIEDPNLPISVPATPTVSKTAWRGRVELLLPFFLHAEFWVRSGLTRNQLTAIRKAFADAPQRPATSAIPAEYCTEKMHREAETRRIVAVNKVKKRFKG